MSRVYKRVGKGKVGGAGGGEGRKPEAGHILHWDIGSGAVSSTSDKNRHSPQIAV